MGSASMPCDTTTNGASKTYRASPAGLKSPGSKSRPVHFRKLRASTRVCAMTESACQTGFISKSDCRAQSFRQFLRRQRDGIRLHAAGVRGLCNQIRDMLLTDAVFAEARNLQIADQCANPFDAVVRSCAGTASQQPRHLVVTLQCIAAGGAL